MCGVSAFILVNCLQVNFGKTLQRRKAENEKKQVNRIDGNSIVESLQENACYDSGINAIQTINQEHEHHNSSDGESEDYEDTVNFVDIHIQEKSEYEDVVTATSSENRQRTKSFDTMLNPAYGSSKDCHSVKEETIAIVVVEGAVDNDLQSDYSDVEIDGTKRLCSKELIDNGAYVQGGEYIQMSAAVKTQMEENDVASASRLQTNVMIGETEAVHEYDYPNLASEIPHCDDHARIGATTTHCAVVHAYDYTSKNVVENIKLLSPVHGKQQGQSSSSATNNCKTKCIDNSDCDNAILPSLPSTAQAQVEHAYGNTESVFVDKKSDTFESATTDDTVCGSEDPDYTSVELIPPRDRARGDNTTSIDMQYDHIQILVEDSVCESENKSEDEEEDYTFDRLSECLYVDSQDLLHHTGGSDTVLSSIDNVHYSRLSPVTFWNREWSHEDLARANAVYSSVKKPKVSTKPKLVTLDNTLGTLV